MSTTRYSQAGHKFIIDGEMSVGNQIIVTAVPATGYRFISWEDDSTDNPRTIDIDECGVSYIANFEIDEGCDIRGLYDALVSEFVCGEYGPYESSGIDCETIEQELSDIIGDCNNPSDPIIPPPTDDSDDIIVDPLFDVVMDEETGDVLLLDMAGVAHTLDFLSRYDCVTLVFDNSIESPYTFSIEINGVTITNDGTYTDEEDDVDVHVHTNDNIHTVTYVICQRNNN